MRYYIDFDKTINQLVPYFMGGRKLILYLQALISPLRQANNHFIEWAKETRIEASMTSQTFKFEWYLNRKFSKYFASPGHIVIKNSEPLGVPVYWQSASINANENLLLSKESKLSEESKESESPAVQTSILYRSDEQTNESSVSFIVSTPQIDTSLISKAKYLAMLRFVIDKYRLANKTYTIKYE